MDREEEIIEELKSAALSVEVRLFLDLLALRREKHRNQLEKAEASEVRGRALECKALIQIFD